MVGYANIDELESDVARRKKRNLFQEALIDWERDMPVMEWMEKHSVVAKAALVIASEQKKIKDLK